MKQAQAKHKLCRRLGYCIWNMPKCPSVKRPYAAGLQGKNRKKSKLSTYGVMMQEKQKLKAHYALTESQLRNLFIVAKRKEGRTNEILMQHIEMRLDATVYHSGIAPTIFAAKQFVAHRHILVDGKIVDRPSFRLKPGQVVSINAEKSPKVAEIARDVNSTIPPYYETNKEELKVTVLREPMIEEIPVQVEAMRVVEYYAR
ncbi:MAG: 30S ribosomal protein S4 [Victivallales bacterium]|nr:30S ribosomal protein S4 [bacterium]MDD7752694.1 30S ribosomal protein S4 [bacterium]MDY5696895.1 30S ribosomal protein S4 [Victivallales bacterium]